ncbi:DNA cytosine methyltransferase [Streptomyces sp. HNM0575]|nr:DNA cytosine methyltransferase [Streptomyces sp. HNM0575]
MVSLEICAGAGGQATGLEHAGFFPRMLVDSDDDPCRTLKWNRRSWRVENADIGEFDPYVFEETRGVDLLSGGLPRVQSAATATRVDNAEPLRVLRDAAGLARVVRPRAVLLENMPDLVESDQFAGIREELREALTALGYVVSWGVLNAADHGVPQDRSHGFLVALRDDAAEPFHWPAPNADPAPTLGETLRVSMASKGWPGADAWAARADALAPALVGGSAERGGPDLGPTGQKRKWARLGVEGKSLWNDVPGPGFASDGLPHITVRQAADLQGFPQNWQFCGLKGSTYRQVALALPPLVAAAVGRQLVRALEGAGD